MDEKNLISAAEASRVQAAGVNNLCNVLQGGPINGNSQTNSISANNYYIGSGETPGVGKPYEDGDKVTLKAQDGEEFSATVDLSKPGGSINVDDYENYNEANYDPNNIETKTALCAAPDVAFEQTANFMGGLDNFLAWGNSLIGNDEGKQFYLDKAAECEREENRVHKYFKGLAPDKNLYESKVRQGMLMVDMAMMASLAKDGVVLGVKVAGKMPKSVEELRAILMRCFGKGAGKAIKTQMLESPSAKLWGTLKDGTNQGVKHFTDYWDKFPERIPSLATRLGVDESKFENTIQGFENFTEQASRVKNEYTASKLDVNGKDIYFLEGAEKAKKGVVVIVKDGKIQSMMPSDPKSFGKME